MNKVKLEDIAKINSTTFRVNDFDEILYLDTSSVTKGVFDDFIHLSKNDKIPSRAKRAVKDKTIVYSTVRPNLQHFGIFNNPKENVVVSTGFATIDVIDNLANPKFLYYYLTQDKFTNYLHTVATNNVSSYPSINPSDLASLDLEIPKDVKNQSAIANILSSIDDKMELNSKTNKELQNLAQTIYDYWFVQNADKKWSKEKIADLIQNQKNGDWGKDTKQGNYTEKVTCIRGTDINSLAGNNELKAPKRFISQKNNSNFLTDGDFIIEISGGSPTQSTGRMAYILDEMLKSFENPLICSNFCKAISLKDKKHFYYFIFVWKQLYDNGVFFGYEGKTSGIKNFLFDNFVDSYEITVPPTKILEKFNKTVSPLFSTIIKNKQESANLAQLRDFLLPLLMNGQVKAKIV
ncbi:MAG: restriction endonuclease subunit S [Bacteroidales bacterium]|nr:restriction endonuclease subunit S [Bacteroidales bacterium]